jgi:hypothetical protein
LTKTPSNIDVGSQHDKKRPTRERSQSQLNNNMDDPSSQLAQNGSLESHREGDESSVYTLTQTPLTANHEHERKERREKCERGDNGHEAH